jgi:HSP20 family protein
MAEAPKLPSKSERRSTVPRAAAGPWSAFDALRNDIERVFERFPLGTSLFGQGPGAERPWPGQGQLNITPAVDVSENDKGYEITAELPGMSESDIDIKLSGGTLTIKGEKKEEREESEKGYYMSERRYGAFMRSFPVPEDVDTAKIEASFAKGVLSLKLPKSAEAQTKDKTIPIKTG